MGRRIVALAAGLLLAGCGSIGGGCPTGRTDGWLSGWGSGGSGSFALGMRRAWGCDPASGPVNAGPPPSADPAAKWPVSPSSMTAPPR